MKKLGPFFALLFALTATTYSSAATYTMGYTPPGGVIVTSGGTSFAAGGADYAFSGFNAVDYVNLYWGVNFVANVAQSSVASPGNMMFYSYNSGTGTIVFVSTQNWQFTNTITLGGVSTATQLVVQVQPYGSSAGFLGSGFLVGDTATKGALGITTGGATDPLYQVASGGNFQAAFEFETWDGTPGGIANGTDLLDYYNSHNGGNPTTVFSTSVDFEFWWSTQKTTSKKVQVGTCQNNLTPYSSIQSAVNAVPSGATVEICPGTYPEQVTINAPITLQGIAFGGNQVVVVALPGAGLTQNGTGPVTSFPIDAQILVQDAGPVNISGLTVDGSGGSCPSDVGIAGIVYLSSAQPSSGKVTNSVVRNVASSCGSPQGVALYGENGTDNPSTLTVESNSIHSINGQGIAFGPNQGGTISSNTISQVNGGIAFQNAGPNAKATSNNISSAQNAVSLNNANTVTVQSNTITNTSGTAISLNDSSSTGNNITKNTINEANCGISDSNAGSDVFLPNTILNIAASTCP